MPAASMFQVEIRISDDTTLSDRMEQMRTWLDQRHFEPATFRYAFTHHGFVCPVDFPVEAEAAAFATAFNGRLVSGSPMVI